MKLTRETINFLSFKLYSLDSLIKEDENFYGFSSRILEEIVKNLDLEHFISNISYDRNGNVHIEEYYTDVEGNILLFKFQISEFLVEPKGKKIYAIKYPNQIEIYDGDAWRKLDFKPILSLYTKQGKNVLLKKFTRILDEVLHPPYII